MGLNLELMDMLKCICVRLDEKLLMYPKHITAFGMGGGNVRLNFGTTIPQRKEYYEHCMQLVS